MPSTVFFSNYEVYAANDKEIGRVVSLTEQRTNWRGKWGKTLTHTHPKVRIWDEFDGKGDLRGNAVVIGNVVPGSDKMGAPSWEALIFHPGGPLTHHIVRDIEDVVPLMEVKDGWRLVRNFNTHASVWVVRLISKYDGKQVGTAVVVPRTTADLQPKKLRKKSPGDRVVEARKKLIADRSAGLRSRLEATRIQRGWEAAREVVGPYTEADEWDAETKTWILPIIQYDLDGNAVGIV